MFKIGKQKNSLFSLSPHLLRLVPRRRVGHRSTAMQSGAPPASSSPGNDEDDFHWDAAAEAELQAIEAAHGSAKRRSLPDRPNNPAVRPRQNLVPAAGGASSGAPSWVLSPPTCQGNVKAMNQPIKFSGKIVYCRTPSEVEKATVGIVNKIKSMKASGQVSLGFDLEWRPFPRRGDPPRKVAVMQLCMDKTHCYIMHIIHSGVPPILKSLLEDSSSIKVGICIDNDARKMSNDYDVRVQPLMDLSNLANVKLAGPPKRWGLASLTQMITCKELPKPSNIRMGNWEACVLSKKQLQYAATDAYISWYLYEVLQSLPDNNVEAEKEPVRCTKHRKRRPKPKQTTTLETKTPVTKCTKHRKRRPKPKQTTTLKTKTPVTKG